MHQNYHGKPRKGTPEYWLSEWRVVERDTLKSLGRLNGLGRRIKETKRKGVKAALALYDAEARLGLADKAWLNETTDNGLLDAAADATRHRNDCSWAWKGIMHDLAEYQRNYAVKHERRAELNVTLAAARDNIRSFERIIQIRGAIKPRTASKRPRKSDFMAVAPGVVISRWAYELYKRALPKRARIQEAPDPKGWRVSHERGHAIFRSIEDASAA